jgi:hypothetical protein
MSESVTAVNYVTHASSLMMIPTAQVTNCTVLNASRIPLEAAYALACVQARGQ